MSVPLVTNLSFLFKTPRIYLTFLSQRNDLNIKEYHKTSSFRQIWLDTPGDRPKDIRARRFAGEIHPLCDSQIRRHLSSFCIPIFRATFNCAEACCRDMEAEREDEEMERQRNSPSTSSSASTDIDSEQDLSNSEPKSKLPRKRTANATRTCKVLLHVSIAFTHFVYCLCYICSSPGGDNGRQTRRG